VGNLQDIANEKYTNRGLGLKILQISASYKPAFIYGGPILSVSILAEQLVKAGEQVNVYTTNANGPHELNIETGKQVLLDDVPVTYFKRITKDHTHLSPALLKSLWKNAHNYDVIHIHAWWNLVSVLSCLVALMRKVPVLVSPRGTLSNYSFNNRNNQIKGLIHSWMGKPLLKKCFIHTTSKNEYDALREILPNNILFNIPNFINLSSGKNLSDYQPEPYLKLIFFSRIEEKKGLDILLQALTTVTVHYKLTIAGDGNPLYVDHLKKIAQDYGISENINWIGFQTENKYDLLYQHDLMVLPSYDENFGNVVIESLSVGTPVLISDQVGLADYVEENNLGWICKTDAVSVSDAINNIAVKKADINRIRKGAPLKIAADFDYQNMVAKYINMYKQILQNERI
jgi:glycosyltransferase involved in cell wall biosynthesis